MDGVLADFIGALSIAQCKPNPYTDPAIRGAALGCWDTDKLWGISVKEFWAPSNTYEFWDTINKTPEADDIVDLVYRLVGEENVAMLTAPSTFEGCIPAKRAWIRRHYGDLSKRMIFTLSKEFLATPTNILIDDRDKNVDDYYRAGGPAILVPRLWNRLHALANIGMTLDFVEEKLNEAIRSK